MIQDIEPKKFDITYEDVKIESQDCVLPIYDEEAGVMLLTPQIDNKEEAGLSFIKYGQMRKHTRKQSRFRYCFKLDNRKFFLMKIDGSEKQSWGKDLHWVNQRESRSISPKWIGFVLSSALQIQRWYDGRKFCGKCGKPMVHISYERAMYCKKCKITEYPKICPAIIVGVIKGNEIMLTRYADSPHKRFALIAGYGEVGETLEDTVRREVFEEVGLKVKNIQYYKSQPWAFSDSLLVGFFAELDGNDEVTIDKRELAEALWVEKEHVPVGNEGIALTEEMMNYFAAGRVKL